MVGRPAIAGFFKRQQGFLECVHGFIGRRLRLVRRASGIGLNAGIRFVAFGSVVFGSIHRVLFCHPAVSQFALQKMPIV